jgi:hypothetical protein
MLMTTSLHSSTVGVETKTYLLKVSNVFEAAQLVESVGGRVTDTAATLDYLGATLTAEQLNLLCRSELVVRVSEEQHSAISDETLASIWWRKKSSKVASIWWRKNGRNA